MRLDAPSALLGGLSPTGFMRRHWQKRPLRVRAAMPDVVAPASRRQLFELAASDDVESRVVERSGPQWKVRHGPFTRRSLPAFGKPGWTLLVQGVDLHLQAGRRLLDAFRFVPDARLDDLMVSWASGGGGVGPHVDAYDVFLLQVQGRRRWRIGRVDDDSFVPGLPLKILRSFEPEHDWVLEPGDLLYLPPRWGHDGIASGECMTCSIGFRVPTAADLATQLLQRMADLDESAAVATAGRRGRLVDRLYRDPGQPAAVCPAAVPGALQAFARRELQRQLSRPGAVERALGEWLSEPKDRVWFEADRGGRGHDASPGVRLDRRTRMLYDARHLFVNGEAFLAGGHDRRLLRQLADRRRLSGAGCSALSAEARAVLAEWLRSGWMHAGEDEP